MGRALIRNGRWVQAGSAERWRPGVVTGVAVILGLILAGYVVPLPYDPTAPDAMMVLQPPSAAHWFGTDASGFDVFSRTIEAPRRDLPLAIAGTLLSLAIGVPLGLLGSNKTRLAELLMRGLDVFQAFPLVIIAIAIVTLTGNHIQNVVYAIAVINVPRFMRLIRSEALALRESRFMEAAVAVGCSPARLLFRHLLPNVREVILVQASLAAAYALIVIASLNFLGIGVSPPAPTWGSMIQSGAQNMAAGQWWVSLFPSIGLFIAVLSFNAIANGLQLEQRTRAEAMLEIEDLVTQFTGRAGIVHAVNGVSFAVGDGEIVGLVGESGSGKSVTVRSIIGIVRPPGRVVRGSIRLGGRELAGMKNSELRRIRGAKIGFVGQSPFAALNPILTIGEQFRNVVNAHRRSSSKEAAALAVEKLTAVRMPGIERVLSGYAHELSGGMAQRVVIALAMLLDPPLLIADEPTTALDVTVQREILELLRELMAAGERSMLLVSHDLGVVAQYCQKVVVMYAGKVVEQGPVAIVFRSPAHPYTRALLDAVPRPGRAPLSMRGAPPDLTRYPTGCPYAARCSRVFDRCLDEVPGPVRLEEDREVHCFAPIREAVVSVTPSS